MPTIHHEAILHHKLPQSWLQSQEFGKKSSKSILWESTGYITFTIKSIVYIIITYKVCAIYIFYVSKHYNRLTYVYICIPFFKGPLLNTYLHTTDTQPSSALCPDQLSPGDKNPRPRCWDQVTVWVSLAPWWFPPKQNSMEMTPSHRPCLSLQEVTQLPCKFATASPEP